MVVPGEGTSLLSSCPSIYKVKPSDELKEKKLDHEEAIPE